MIQVTVFDGTVPDFAAGISLSRRKVVQYRTPEPLMDPIEITMQEA
jgi:hypothetical protein